MASINNQTPNTGPMSATSAANASGETSAGEFVSLEGLLRVVWERLWVIVLVAIVVVSVAVGYSLMQTPTYESSVKILIGQEAGTEAPGSLGGQVEGLQKLT